MVYCKTAAILLLTHWSYCDLALNHWFMVTCVTYTCNHTMPTYGHYHFQLYFIVTFSVYTNTHDIPQVTSGYWHHVVTPMLASNHYQPCSNPINFCSIKTLTVLYFKAATSASYSCVSLVIGTRFHNPTCLSLSVMDRDILTEKNGVWNDLHGKRIQYTSPCY